MMWKEHFRIGIQTIDEQHEELFLKVGNFLKALRQKGAWEEKLPQVKETMTFMQQYVVSHFAYEEKYQQQINYPYFEEHCKIHEDFKNEVNNFAVRLEQEGYPEELVQQLGGKLLAWLINHVTATDLKMANYVDASEVTRI